MNRTCYTIYLLLAVTLLATGCYKKEEALTPTTEDQGYVVPQGNNAYDARILDFYNKYGKYILYIYTDKDTYWTPSGWKNATQNASGAWLAGYEQTPANTTYISAQLDLMEKQWFSFYTDKFLKEFLPVKIMLCQTLDSVYPKYVFTPVFSVEKGVKSVGAWYNYDNMCVNYGNADVLSMTLSDSLTFLAKCNLMFMRSIAGRGLSTPLPGFASITNYNATLSNQAAAYANGIITVYYNPRSAQIDWNAYIEAMVGYSETMLNTNTAATNSTFMGILNPTKDSKGVIRRRYNIVRNYFIDTYGVDLQAIGNAANP